MRRLVVPLLAAATLAIAAPGVVAAGLAPTVPSGPTAPTPPGAPVVVLLEPGAAPQSELRYALTPGTTQRVVLSTNSRIRQRLADGTILTGRVPNLDLDIEATVGALTPEGAITVAYGYTGIDVDDDSAQDAASARQLRRAIEPIVGLTGTLSLTPRGEVLTSDVVIPDDLDASAAQLVDQLAQQTQSFTVPFPVEPVGVGARWRATSETTVSGITVRQTATYVLEARRGNEVELSVTITQRAPRQTFTAPETDTRVTLRSSRGGGTGTATLRLDEPLTSRSRSNIQIRQKLAAEGDRLTQTVTVNVFVEPG